MHAGSGEVTKDSKSKDSESKDSESKHGESKHGESKTVNQRQRIKDNESYRFAVAPAIGNTGRTATAVPAASKKADTGRAPNAAGQAA